MINNFKSFLNEEALFKKIAKKKVTGNTNEDIVRSCGYSSIAEYEKDIKFLNKYHQLLRLGKYTKNFNVSNIRAVKSTKEMYAPYVEDLETLKLNLSDISDAGYRLNITLQNLGSYGGDPTPTFGFMISVQSKREVNNNNMYNAYNPWFSTEELIDIIECFQTAEGRLETKFSGINVNQQFINSYVIPEGFIEAQQQHQQRQNAARQTCPTCGGNGGPDCANCHGNGCDACDGEGYIQCQTCHGDGVLHN